MPGGGFRTPDGRRVPTVTADEVRAVDRVAVEDVGLPPTAMLENAGRTLAAVVRERADGPVAVLAGGGGNGGGGLAAARHLQNHGVDVRVVLDRSPDAYGGVPADQLRVLRSTGVPVATDGFDGHLADAALAVDAVVGYGLAGAPRATSWRRATPAPRRSSRWTCRPGWTWTCRPGWTRPPARRRASPSRRT